MSRRLSSFTPSPRCGEGATYDTKHALCNGQRTTCNTHTHTHTHTHTRTHARTHACTYTHTHTHTPRCKSSDPPPPMYDGRPPLCRPQIRQRRSSPPKTRSSSWISRSHKGYDAGSQCVPRVLEWNAEQSRMGCMPRTGADKAHCTESRMSVPAASAPVSHRMRKCVRLRHFVGSVWRTHRTSVLGHTDELFGPPTSVLFVDFFAGLSSAPAAHSTSHRRLSTAGADTQPRHSDHSLRVQGGCAGDADERAADFVRTDRLHPSLSAALLLAVSTKSTLTSP